MILKNDREETLFATNMATRGVKEPEDIKILTIFGSLQICLRMEIRKIIVESDRLLMVSECQAISSYSSILGHLVAEIKKRLHKLLLNNVGSNILLGPKYT